MPLKRSRDCDILENVLNVYENNSPVAVETFKRFLNEKYLSNDQHDPCQLLLEICYKIS